jgi:hypothetical protein
MGMFKNYRAAWKGSGSYGRALKMERSGDEQLALQMARNGLAALSRPGVDRYNPHTSSVLIQLTAMSERLAYQLNETGASNKDLEDTHINITRIYGKSGQKYNELLKYIERKLGYVPSK